MDPVIFKGKPPFNCKIHLLAHVNRGTDTPIHIHITIMINQYERSMYVYTVYMYAYIYNMFTSGIIKKQQA